MDRPKLYLIAGPNGAGKSTLVDSVMPELDTDTFLNADNFAKEMSPEDPEAALFAAGKLMLTRVDEEIAARRSFIAETTMSGKAHLSRLRDARTAGFYVTIHFVWISSAQQSRQRVDIRVRRGGHDVPDEAIRRRHPRTIRNFLRLYLPLANDWSLYDNSANEYRLVASGLAETVDEMSFQKLLRV